MNYQLQTFESYSKTWIVIRDYASKNYCEGYISAMRNYGPRPAFRIVHKKDGKVIDEIDQVEEVYIGQVAGWPTAEQYERAGKKALEQANIIRKLASVINNFIYEIIEK